MAKPAFHFQRFEFKYILPSGEAARIIEDCLANNLAWDPYVAGRPEKHYTVTSLYLDSIGWRCYHEKSAGLKERFKIRLRTYGELTGPASDIFFEIKKKSDALVVKDRVILPRLAYEEIFDRRVAIFRSRPDLIGERATAEEIAWHIATFALRPRVVVSYRRMPLVGKFVDRLRITFDSDLRVALGHDLFAPRFHRVAPNFTIMEVKFNNTLPVWFHHIIEAHNLERQAFSKYGRGVERLRELHLIS